MTNKHEQAEQLTQDIIEKIEDFTKTNDWTLREAADLFSDIGGSLEERSSQLSDEADKEERDEDDEIEEVDDPDEETDEEPPDVE
jgi:gas vesicle protein